MAKEYLERLAVLLDPTVRKLGPGMKVEIKHFFSGAAAYANGRIYITLITTGLALKLPEDSRSRLMKAGAKPLRYFPKGPVKKDYAVVPAAFRTDKRKLALWARRSIDHALTLPLPRPKRKAQRKAQMRGPPRP